MPFASQKQRAFLHMKEPAMAARWEAEAKAHKEAPVQPQRKKRKEKATGTAANVLMGNNVDVGKRLTAVKVREAVREGRKAQRRVQLQQAMWEMNAAVKAAKQYEKATGVPLSPTLYRTAELNRAWGKMAIGKRRGRTRGRQVGRKEAELLRMQGTSLRELSPDERELIRRAHIGEQAGRGASIATSLEPWASRYARTKSLPNSLGIPEVGGAALGAAASRNYVPPRLGPVGVRVEPASALTRMKHLAKPVLGGAALGAMVGGMRNTGVIPGMLVATRHNPSARDIALTRFTAKTARKMGQGALAGGGAGLAYGVPRALTAYDIRLDLDTPQGAWVQGAYR